MPAAIALLWSGAAANVTKDLEALDNRMAKEEAIEIEGLVEELLRNSTFRVTLANGHSVLATIAGKMRKFRIRVLAGDRVTLALSPYDLTRGRIVYRHK